MKMSRRTSRARELKSPTSATKSWRRCGRSKSFPPPLPRPAPEPLADEVRHSIRCTVRLPNPEKDDPGQIIEGSYSLPGNVLRVYDDTDRLLGTGTLKPGDDAVHAA